MKMWNFRGHSVMTLGLLGAVFVFVFASLANATTLGSIDTTISGTFTSSTGSFTGTYEEWVVTDSSTGDLDFVYQLTDSSSSTGAFDQVSVSDFGNTVTSTEDFASGYGSVGTVAPSLIGGTGGTVDFNFDSSGNVNPGQTTYDLVVLTDATNYASGSIFIQDGGNTTVAGFASTPEPGSVGLLLGGLLGLGLLVTRKLRAQQQS